MLPEWTVAGFSGHRNLADEKIAADGLHNIFERLAANHGPLATVSSAASGSDTLFVEEAARRKLPYLLILPFSKTRFQQDFKPAEWQRIHPHIENATHVEEVSGEESNEGAYMEAGILAADKADVMVVVWDGKPAAGFGGTGDVVNYVRELGKPLIIIDPMTGNISEERMAQLPAKSLSTSWNEKPRETLEKHFEELDKTAGRHAPRSRDLVLRIVLFQLAASAVGLTALTFENHESRGIINALSTPVELLLLAVAFISALEHRKKLDEWMNNRIGAEICRSFLAMWDMRRRPDHFPNLSIRGFDRLCRNLRIIRALDKTPPPPLQLACDRYLKERVEDQIQFFSSTGGAARVNFRKLKGIMLGGTAAATLCSLVSFIHYSLKIKGWALIVPSYLSLLLPLVSTAAFLLIVTQDYSRRAVRYAEMLGCLEDMKRRLKQVKTWNSLARIGSETEEQLLQEIVEWHSFRRFAGEPN